MGFLDRFFRSDLRLTCPNFDSANTELFDFSGTTVEIKDPGQTATIPYEGSRTKINIFSTNENSLQNYGNHVYTCYKRGWDFFGSSGDAKGGVICDMLISYFPKDLDEKFSQFMFLDQVKSLLVHWHVIWGRKSKAKEFGVRGLDDYIYPVSEKDVEWLDKGDGVVWLKTEGRYLENAPTIKYSIPLTARHNLIVTFRLFTYRDTDFLSPVTNVRETALGVVDDFMSNIKVSYSEESKKDLLAAR